MIKEETILVRIDSSLKNETEGVKTPDKMLNETTINAMEEKELEEFKNPSKLYEELKV